MRIITFCLLLLMLSGIPNPCWAGEIASWELEWPQFRDRFLTAEGRVLDSGNKQVSHTEGQGWAMLFAEACGDRDSFERIWSWTRSNLQRPDSGLFAWKWDPSGTNPISDGNNASDGDVLIAWALLRAARHWNEPAYGRPARRILAAIRSKLLYNAPHRLVLLPGFDGFRTEEGGIVVNPSYYVYPALKEFARAMPIPEWQRLRRDGLAMLSEARFGRWKLTPDWVDLRDGGEVALSDKFPARFGFDAVRVPLYLIWAGEATPERLSGYLDFWNGFEDRPIPAWADLTTDAVAPYAAPTGFQAIVQLARFFRQPREAVMPILSDKDDYYSASLILLSRIAQHEIAR